MNTLDRIQSDLAFMGWCGSPSFTHKRDAAGTVIAQINDATWSADFAQARIRAERVAALREAERRRIERTQRRAREIGGL